MDKFWFYSFLRFQTPVQHFDFGLVELKLKF
jgi:hypothetical protein